MALYPSGPNPPTPPPVSVVAEVALEGPRVTKQRNGRETRVREGESFVRRRSNLVHNPSLSADSRDKKPLIPFTLFKIRLRAIEF